MLYIIAWYTTATTVGFADHRIRADLEAIRQSPKTIAVRPERAQKKPSTSLRGACQTAKRTLEPKWLRIKQKFGCVHRP